MTGRQTRAERATTPLARDSIRKIAESVGGCLRPVQLRRTDTVTGQTVPVMVSCGATLANICPPCAERAKTLRAAQCREGWHLEDEPDLTPAPPDEIQEFCLILRAEAQLRRNTAAAAGQDTIDYDHLIGELDDEITRAGIRGTVTTHRGSRGNGSQRGRRSRSTRRRQDAAPLPARKITPRTVGKVFTAPDGKRYRPSMFLTLTCDSYGKVNDDGTPADPASYDYTRAARDAIHFAALFDRFIQNLRRVLGYEAQYFGGVEPQKRLAPHVHLAVRGSVPRPLLRQVLAATYHQVWWPATDTVVFDGNHLPVWDEDSGNYLDPAIGEILQTWEDALDAIGPHDQPRHVARFGPKFDAQGVLAGSKDANKCIGYLTKYLTKQVADCHVPETEAQRAHADRLAETLRYEPCSPACANWLRYGIQPKNPRPGLVPGACKGKAHRPEHCGYAGRRVLVSRKWSGKSLTDHRADRKAWLVQTLGLEVPDPTRYTWAQVTPADPDYLPPERRLLHVVADRVRWKAALDEARQRAGPLTPEVSATGEVLTVAQVFELADLLGRRSFGNIRKVIGGYRLRYARNGQMRAHPEVFATRPAAEWALWAMGRDGLADTNHDRRYRALVLLAAFASLRWGEATALRRCDIDLSAGAVRVRAAFVERSTGELVLGAPKSRAGRRVVGIPAAIIPVLQEHLAVYVAQAPGALLFTGVKGGPLRRSNFNKMSA